MRIGAKLEDATELLFRQVHPAFVRDGRPSSQVFRPTPKDEGMLSVNGGSKTNPATAFEQFVTRPGCTSCGVLAASVAECAVEQLAAYEAPLEAADDGYDDPSHAIVDYRNVAKSAAEKKSGRLVRVAMVRGFLHGPRDAAAPPAGASQPESAATIPAQPYAGSGDAPDN